MAVRAIPRLLLAAVNILLEAPIEIAADEQVELAVVVVVEKAGARAPSGGRHSRLRRHILKRAVAAIPVENIGTIGGQVEILKSVVIIIADGDAHSVPGPDPGQARLLGDIGEFSVAIVPVEPIPVLGVALVDFRPRRHRVLEPGAVSEEDIEIAIVIVVKKRDASAHCLQQVLVGGWRILMPEIDAGRGSDLLEHAGLRRE